MKLLLFVLLLPLFSFSQTDSIPRNAEGRYEYTGVVNVDSASADKLYSNAKLFIVEAFKSGKDVTQLNDDDAKTVAGSGNDKIVTKGMAGSAIDKRIKFRIFIQCKEGRYKYTINNFEISFVSQMVNNTVPFEYEKGYKNKYLSKKQTEEVYEIFKSDMANLIEKLKKTMASETSLTKDW